MEACQHPLLWILVCFCFNQTGKPLIILVENGLFWHVTATETRCSRLFAFLSCGLHVLNWIVRICWSNHKARQAWTDLALGKVEEKKCFRDTSQGFLKAMYMRDQTSLTKREGDNQLEALPEQSIIIHPIISSVFLCILGLVFI